MRYRCRICLAAVKTIISFSLWTEVVAWNSSQEIEWPKLETFLTCSCAHYLVAAISASLALDAIVKA